MHRRNALGGSHGPPAAAAFIENPRLIAKLGSRDPGIRRVGGRGIGALKPECWVRWMDVDASQSIRKGSPVRRRG